MKPHLSVSQVNMITRCGLQYYHRYILGIKAPPGVSLIKGKATHKGVECDLTSKIQNGELLPDEQIADTVRDSVNQEWDSEEIALTPDEKTRGADAVKGDTVDGAIRLAKLHHTDVAPVVEPVHLEREFRIVMDRFPYDLKGFIDIQESNRIRDTKTAGKSPIATAADESIQLTAYALAVKVLDGNAPEVVQLDTLVDTKTPKVVQLQSTRNSADFKRFLRRVEHVASVVEKGAFLPAPEDSWACSEKFCGYWNVCPFGAKGRIR